MPGWWCEDFAGKAFDWECSWQLGETNERDAFALGTGLPPTALEMSPESHLILEDINIHAHHKFVGAEAIGAESS